MSEAADDFAALLARARQGDHAALTELVRRYEPDIRIAASVRLGPSLRPYLDSMDVVQSVHRSLLVELRKDRYTFESLEKLIGFAVRIVQRKIAHYCRKPRPHGNGQPCDLEQPPATQAQADDPARHAEFRDYVLHLCRDLDVKDRQLVELRLQGYSTAEAARAMGEKEGVLRVRLQRLRHRLRELGITPEDIQRRFQ